MDTVPHVMDLDQTTTSAQILVFQYQEMEDHFSFLSMKNMIFKFTFHLDASTTGKLYNQASLMSLVRQRSMPTQPAFDVLAHDVHSDFT